MTCKRCNRRITYHTVRNNGGYCENCLILVAQELVNKDDFNNNEADEQWRRVVKESITELYNSLKNAGMEDPLTGMHRDTKSLMRALKVKIK